MPQNDNFAHDLLLGLVSRVDELYGKIDNEVSKLESQNNESHAETRRYLQDRLTPIEDKLDEYADKVNKHESTFGFIGLMLTTGVASATALFTWVINTFGVHK